MEGEGVTAVHFADSFPGKNNFDLSKCLYIGTSLGSVLVIVIVVPEAETRWGETKQWWRVRLWLRSAALVVREKAIKFANRASHHSPGQQNTISHISHQGREIKKASFLIKREVGVTSSFSIPFGGRGLGQKSSQKLAKVLSCVLCSTLPDLFLIVETLCFVFNSPRSVFWLWKHCRERESVIVSPSGSLLRLKSPILEFCLLDSSFALAERWHQGFLFC